MGTQSATPWSYYLHQTHLGNWGSMYWVLSKHQRDNHAYVSPFLLALANPRILPKKVFPVYQCYLLHKAFSSSPNQKIFSFPHLNSLDFYVHLLPCIGYFTHSSIMCKCCLYLFPIRCLLTVVILKNT